VEIYDRNIYLMSEGMKSVLKILRDENFEGIFFWRNAMCNTRFDAEIFENKRFDDIITQISKFLILLNYLEVE